jgi:hypothetical protein
VLYLRSLTRVLRRRTPWFAGFRPFGVATAVWREVVVPPVLLTLLPRHLALSWPVLVHSDVGLLAATVSVLGLATLVLRAGFALRGRRSAPGGAEAPEEASDGPPATVSARAEPVGTT